MRLLAKHRHPHDPRDLVRRQLLQTLAAQLVIPRDEQAHQDLDDVLISSIPRSLVQRQSIARQGVQEGEDGEKVDLAHERGKAEWESRDTVLGLEPVEV